MNGGGPPEYDAELRDVLTRRDAAGLRALMQKYNDVFRIPDEIFVEQDSHWWDVLVHKLTCSRPDLFAQHRESTEWLTSRGYSTDLGGY